MKKFEPPVKFEELFPDYPIKKVSKAAYLPGVVHGLIALGLMAGLTLGTLFVLSKIRITLPQPPRANSPATEEEMMASLPAEKLYDIAVNCMSVKDGDCARKIFEHLMKVNPQFINSDSKRKKIMSEASAL